MHGVFPVKPSELVDEARRLQGGSLEFKGLRDPYSNNLTRFKGAPAPWPLTPANLDPGLSTMSTILVNELTRYLPRSTSFTSLM